MGVLKAFSATRLDGVHHLQVEKCYRNDENQIKKYTEIFISPQIPRPFSLPLLHHLKKNER